MAAGAVVSAGVGSVSKPANVQTAAHRLDARALVGPPAEVTEAQSTVDLVNAERARHGLPPFAWNDSAGEAAHVHSADMAQMGVMQHDGSDGSNAGDRLTAAGFRWASWGETVGAGQPGPADIVSAWLNSPPHKEILLGDFTYVGVSKVVGQGVPYWTLVVATAP